MKYERLYADDLGETRFQKIEIELTESDYRPPAPLLFVSHANEASAIQFVHLPAGWDGKDIVVPKSQFFICVEGEVEITARGGAKRTVRPGDTVLMEDTSG